MERNPTSRIRELIVYSKTINGDPYRIAVGQEVKAGAKKILIEEIVRDENAAILFNCLKYIVYASVVGSKDGRIQVWKNFENCVTETISFIDEE